MMALMLFLGRQMFQVFHILRVRIHYLVRFAVHTYSAIGSIQAQLGIGDTSPSEILDLESIPALLGENKFYISMNDFTSGRYYIVLIDPLNKQISTSYSKEN